LDLLTLKSPIDGVLNNLNCQLGQTIGAGATVGDIVDAYQLQVTVWMPPRNASQVNRGQTARIAPSGTVKDPNADEGDDDENTVEGTVTFVGQVVDPQTGNLPVQIAIDNSDGKFAVGAIVAAAITVEEVKEVLAIPTAALFDIGEGSVINIIRNGKSVRAEPKLGVQDRQWAEISGTDLKDPLKAGEMVIVEGGYNLPDGTEVAIAAEAADEEPDAKGDKLAKKDAAEPAAEKSTEKAKTSAAGATP
jgi:RND family efflux transporter MFP subunit